MSILLKIVKLINPTLSTDVRRRGEEAVRETTDEAFSVARQRVVVWSGDLMRDIRVIREGPFRASIANNLPYARKIHSDRPYLTDALNAVRPRWEARLKGIYSKSRVGLPGLPTLSRYPSRMAQKYGKYAV